MFAGKFSHLRFSLRDLMQQDVEIAVDFRENMHGMVFFGREMGFNAGFSSSMQGSFVLTRGRMLEADLREVMGAEAQAHVAKVITADFRDAMGANVSIGANKLVISDLREAMHSVITSGAVNEELTADFREIMHFEYDPEIKDTEVEMHFRSSLGSVIAVDVTEIDYAIIDAVIQPGSTLRIDSDNYTILLDSISRLHMHRGDWAMINRGAIELVVLTHTGGQLDGEVLYTERYL